MAGSLLRSACIAALAGGVSLGAQERPGGAATPPASATPPAGLCRVWLRDVAAAQQPAPTDCATAIRKAPKNATVLFGDLRHEAAQPRSTPSSRSRVDSVAARMASPGPRMYGVSRGTTGRGATQPGTGRATTVNATGQAVIRTDPPPPAKPPERPQS